MNAFDRYFHGPYRAVRAYVFVKSFLSLVALDTWMLMIGHAGRYGVGEFNVAHFGWLDRAVPVPSAGLYVAVLLSTGLLALGIALSGSHPLALFALFALYTFSWAMSMLDSYQHHYFVSSVLLCLVFFPRLTVADVVAAESARRRGPRAAERREPNSPDAAEETAASAPPRDEGAVKEATTAGASSRDERAAKEAVASGPPPRDEKAAKGAARKKKAGGRPHAQEKTDLARDGSHGPSLGADDLYAIGAGAAIALYLGVDVSSHPWLWFLLCFSALAGLTWYRSRRRRNEPARLVSGFGFNLLGATAAVLYCFTSIAKMDGPWTAGFTLQRISAAGRVFAPLLEWARVLGISDATFWSIVSTSVIPLELGVALGYALAVVQDSSASHLPRWGALLAFWAALNLHVGAEALHLEIGWFSYYMLLFACCYLLPGPVIETLGQLVVRPAQLLQAQLGELDDPTRERAGEAWIAILGACGLLGGIAYLIDLPGAVLAATAACVSLLTLGIRGVVQRKTAPIRRTALGVGVAATIMWTAISLSSVRWDFYRYLGGDLSRRGETRAALDAFVKGERYAPKGETRRKKIEQLRRKLAESSAR